MKKNKIDFYYTIRGLFAVFISQTKESEDLMNQLLINGDDKVFITHLPAFLQGLKAAGYSVRKKASNKNTTTHFSTKDELLLKKLFS